MFTHHRNCNEKINGSSSSFFSIKKAKIEQVYHVPVLRGLFRFLEIETLPGSAIFRYSHLLPVKLDDYYGLICHFPRLKMMRPPYFKYYFCEYWNKLKCLIIVPRPTPTDSKLSSQIIKRRCEKRTISSGLAQ